MKDKKPNQPAGKATIKHDMVIIKGGRKTPTAPTFLKPPLKKK